MNCFICETIAAIERGESPVVKAYPSGYAILHPKQERVGYTLFLSKLHARELHELPPIERHDFLRDMSLVAKAVYDTYHPRKLNYELLGNREAHLHWHIVPRYSNEQFPNQPLWYEKGYTDALREVSDNE